MKVNEMDIMNRLTVTAKKAAIKWLEDIASSASIESKQRIRARDALRIINCQRDRLNRQSDQLNRQNTRLNSQFALVNWQNNHINYQGGLIKLKDDLLKAKDDLIKRQDEIIKGLCESHTVSTLKAAA